MIKSIKDYRIEFGMTQREFAELLNVSLNTVQKWESGLRQPTHAKIIHNVLENYSKKFKNKKKDKLNGS